MEKIYYISKEQFKAVKQEWKKRDRTAWEHVVYNILRSKVTDCGFVVKTKHIQGNDEWYAYNEAVSRAKFYLKRINFKETFGIEMPVDFASKLENIKK